MEKHKTSDSYSRAATFSKKGQPATEVYCLKTGSAKVTLEDSISQQQSIVRLVEPGDMLGYRCIFSKPAYRGTASALTPSIACKISRNTILQMIESNPRFALELMKRMGNEIAAAEYHHHSFCQKSVRERLAEGLSILAKKFGQPGEAGIKICTKLTRTEFAQWIGTSRETLIRELSGFIQESTVCMEDGFILVLDLDRLLEISGIEEKPENSKNLDADSIIAP